ncbi:unnamed protein product, partial [Ixodes pacificus]
VLARDSLRNTSVDIENVVVLALLVCACACVCVKKEVYPRVGRTRGTRRTGRRRHAGGARRPGSTERSRSGTNDTKRTVRRKEEKHSENGKQHSQTRLYEHTPAAPKKKK